MRADRFDAFISYSRADWGHAADIESLLSAASMQTFFDRRDLSPGLPWVRALEDAIGRCGCAVILIGQRGFGNTQQYERELAFFRQTRDPQFRIIPVLLPGTNDLPAGFLQLLTWIDFSTVKKIADAPDQVARLLKAIRGDHTPSRLVIADICPYRGLDAFREEDAAFYFGRGSIDDPSTPIGELVAKTRSNSFVMVVGRSGSGKSSLVFAGLVPALRRNHLDTFWHILSFRPGADPLRTLAETFNVRGENEGAVGYAEKITGETARLRDGNVNSLGHVVRDYLDRADGKPDRLLLYVDQWEELYAQAAVASSDERAAQQRQDVDRFIDLLLAATQGAPVTVVATVRADFYDSLVRHPQLRSVLPAQQVNLTSIPRPELRRSITEPARMVGLKFEPPSLVDRILDDAGEDEGMLPLLQYALKETFACREGHIMTADSYERSGGVQRAIRTTAERNFEQLSTEDQVAARQLFLRLVTPGEGQEDTRARAAMPNALDLQKIVQNFAGPKTRLLVTGRDLAGRATVEVAHEALIRTWPRLREWVDKNREMLRARSAIVQAQAEWERNGRRNDLLLPAGFQLERARALSDNPGDITIEDIQDYISKSIEFEQQRLDKERDEAIEEERGRREAAELSRKRFQRYFIAACILGVFAFGNLIYAMIARNTAMSAGDAARSAENYALQEKSKAEVERDRAQKSLILAEQLVSVQAHELQKVEGIRQETLKRILDGSKKAFDELALVLEGNGAFQMSYADIMTEYGRLYLKAGDLTKSQDSFEQSLNILERGDSSSDRVSSLRGIAVQREELAGVLQQAGKLDKAIENSDRALNLRTRIVNLSESDPLSFRDLGLSLYQRADLIKLTTGNVANAVDLQDTARIMMITARSLGGNKSEIDLKLSLIYGSMADYYDALGNVPKRRESLSESLRLLEELHAANHDDKEITRYLAWANQYLGDFYLDQHDWEAASDQYLACLKLRKQQADEDSSDWRSQYDLAWAYHSLGALYLSPGNTDLEKAKDNYQSAYDIREKLTEIDSTNKRWKKDFALSLVALGDIARRENKNDVAKDIYESARTTMQDLVKDAPTNMGWISILSNIQTKLSAVTGISAPVPTLSSAPSPVSSNNE